MSSPTFGTPAWPQTQRAKSAHQYSGCPPLPVQLEAKAPPPSLLIEHAPLPTLARAICAMSPVVLAADDEDVESTEALHPPANAARAPRTTNLATSAFMSTSSNAHDKFRRRGRDLSRC